MAASAGRWKERSGFSKIPGSFQAGEIQAEGLSLPLLCIWKLNAPPVPRVPVPFPFQREPHEWQASSTT